MVLILFYSPNDTLRSDERHSTCIEEAEAPGSWVYQKRANNVRLGQIE